MSDSDTPAPVEAPRKDKRSRDPARWIHRSMENYRQSEQQLAFRPDAAFFAIADPIVQTERTLLGYNRLYVFWQAVRNVARVPGAVAEIGSYKGGSAYFIARAFEQITGAEVPMRVFDTFEGHPAQAITANDPFQEAGQFRRTSYDDVRAYLSPFQQLQIHKGDVSASLPHLAESAYRLVHIDTDLYQPTIVCLEYFVPRLSSGGVIVVDDYASGKCPGVAAAVVEYLERGAPLQVWDPRTEQLMLVKR